MFHYVIKTSVIECYSFGYFFVHTIAIVYAFIYVSKYIHFYEYINHLWCLGFSLLPSNIQFLSFFNHCQIRAVSTIMIIYIHKHNPFPGYFHSSSMFVDTHLNGFSSAKLSRIGSTAAYSRRFYVSDIFCKTWTV